MFELITPILLAILVVLAIIYFIQYGVTHFQMMGLRIKRRSSHANWVEKIDKSEIPPAVAQILAGAEQPLTALGFHYVFAERLEVFYTHITEPFYYHVYFSPDKNTYASVIPSPLPESGQLYLVEFTTFLSQSTLINTMNGFSHHLLPPPNWYHNNDHYVATLEQQWQAHCQTIANAEVSQKQHSADDYIAMQYRFYQELLTVWQEKGWLVATKENNIWRYSLWAGLKLTRQLVKGHRKLKSVLNAYRQQTTDSALDTKTESDTKIATEVHAFEQLVKAENERRRYSWVAKTVWFLVSLLLFSVAFGLVFSWHSMLVLLGVLMLHEFGHLFGMWLFGYRDLLVLFIPLMGAAAIGKKEDATPTQQLIVYLLGPIPGLVLSFVALYLANVTGNSLWIEIGVIAFFLNYFNLLPVTPLDGGRVVETLVFVRFPFARFLFAVASLLLFAVGAWFLDSLVLTVLTILLSLAIPAQWRWSRAVAQIAKTLPRNTDQQTRLHTILRTLSQPPFHRQAFATRFHVAKSLLQHFTAPLPTLKVSIFGGIIYLFTLVMPVYVASQYLPKWVGFDPLVALFNTAKQEDSKEEYNEPDWEAQLSQADSENARWEILMQAGKWQQDLYNYQEAHDYYQRAMRIAELFTDTDERVIDTLVGLAESADSQESRRQYYAQALSLLEQHHGANHPRIADILEDSLWVQMLTLEEQIEQIENVLQIRTQHGLSQTEKNAVTLSTLASFYEQAEQKEMAEQIFLRALSIFQSLKPAEFSSYSLTNAIEELATFYLNWQKPEKAQHVLQQYLAQPNQLGDYNTARLSNLLGWTYLEQNQLMLASDAFEKASAYWNQSDAQSLPLSYLLDFAYINLRNGNIYFLKQHLEDIKQYSYIDGYTRYLQNQIAQNASANQPTFSFTVKRWMAHLEVLQYVLSEQ